MAIPATDAVQAIAFLRHLFKPYTDGFIEIRPLSKHKPHANRTTYRLPECLKGEAGQALSQHIISLAMRGYDVYVGVCPRVAPEGPGRKLGKDAIEQVGAVWVDLDSKVPGSCKEILDTCDIVVSTGNGWHGYKILSSPKLCKSARERTTLEYRIRDFADKLLPGTDNVSNLDRILRVPGTLNWKNPDEPKAVQLIKGGGIKPTYKVSLLVEMLGDERLDALLASAKAGELGHASPMIHHASGRYTGCLDTFFLEVEQACIK
ncbi:MAG: hypothetical protein EBS38_08405, partial [Actinobacteria bacterium]|nr:hypothetical protein [Actinomycetota bacterium]